MLTINIYNRSLTYQVDKVKVVEPTDTKALAPEPGKDYVTLVTCTPYAVNSHRLLVRGHRVDQEERDGLHIVEESDWGEAGSARQSGKPSLLFILVAVLLAVALFAIILAICKGRKRVKERERMQRRRRRGRGRGSDY